VQRVQLAGIMVHGPATFFCQEAPAGAMNFYCVTMQMPEDLPQGLAPGTVAWVYQPMTMLNPMQVGGTAVHAPEAPAPPLQAPPAQAQPPDVDGTVWALSRDSSGSRRVQQALEDAADDQVRVQIATELQGHVWEALQCPHANHVLQKCIVSMRPQALQFIVSEITQPGAGQVVLAARHKYGCRILQRLLEHCQEEQLLELKAELIASAIALSKHAYANFVMQHLFEYGTQEQRRRLSRLFEQHAKALGKHDHGRAVLSKALSHVGREERASLARALLQEQGLLVRMARTRHGHAAVKHVLEALDGTEREAAKEQLMDGVQTLRMSRYGRTVVGCLL